MPCINIRLPGIGTPAPMFRFDSQQPLAQRLMNLQQLPLIADADFTEHWQAPGPSSSIVQGTAKHPISITTNANYQLLSSNIFVGSSCIREITQRVYRQLVELVASSGYPQLVRCWNYVPNINQGQGDNEVYRQFCWGRADAITELDLALPAATGIGSADDWLRIAVLSTSDDTLVRHWENPRQVSAYEYPRQYGPRSPSFARATSVERNGESLFLLSGTSSIVHHKTQHSGDLAAQVAETRRNIDHLLGAYSAGRTKTPKPQAVRFYLRRAQDLELAKTSFERSFSDYPAPSYFAADICRRDLSMEVEAIFD